MSINRLKPIDRGFQFTDWAEQDRLVAQILGNTVSVSTYGPDSGLVDMDEDEWKIVRRHIDRLFKEIKKGKR